MPTDIQKAALVDQFLSVEEFYLREDRDPITKLVNSR